MFYSIAIDKHYNTIRKTNSFYESMPQRQSITNINDNSGFYYPNKETGALQYNKR